MDRNLKEILEENSKKRSFSGKYISEKQAFYYELANSKWIDTKNRNIMKNFILEKNKEIFGENISKITTSTKSEELKNWYNICLKIYKIFEFKILKLILVFFLLKKSNF